MSKGKILAIDYGNTSIGMAVCDENRLMAFGRGVLKNKKHQEILEKIAELARNEGVKLLLVGLPLGKNGEETLQTAKIREFAGQLIAEIKKRKIDLDMEFIDESFSTYEANRLLEKIGVKPRDRKMTEDEMAAIVLVQRYIDFRP